MTEQKKTKGVLPDGNAIKQLRKKLGKTQKGLIQGTTIELRTYQRAEQGVRILPEVLGQIAVVLRADPVALRANKNEVSNGSAVFRLQSISNAGGNQLVKELQTSWTDKIDYNFKINPSGAVAEEVAELVDYCQELEITAHSNRKPLSPANKIRAIGKLNDLISNLAAKGVFAYVGSYNEWDTKRQAVGEMIWEESGEPIEARTPSIRKRIRVVFAHEDTDLITGTYSTWSTRESAYERAIAKNLELGIHPDWLQEHWVFDDDFIEEYRAAFERQNSPQASVPQLVKPLQS
ncbi:hypothetical protein [Hyphomicrobium sp.]|jgi:hypothetical protein|uniref:helix-turn-helix domain-containing protein n=1 Tax=Hyphomicrobium sp. TaxID=82 RepID=UPI002C671635|nr:hypothetical protein [Hyphomicrobium sp.]HVZ03270.1 hypothetical protein [Hyphomicrobium sp.]